MTRILVRPAGAGRETLWVIALCAAIALAAGATAALRARTDATVALADWRVDARDGLNAAEQGVNADLAVAVDDIRAAMETGAAPSPETLAGEALPPFAQDATGRKRGGHVWRLIAEDGATAYLGATGDQAVAGSLLLVMAGGDGHAHDGGGKDASVWRHPSAQDVAGLSNERLIAAGWKQVTSRYDASVTREAK